MTLCVPFFDSETLFLSTSASNSKKYRTFASASTNRDVEQLVAHYVRDVGVGRSSRLIPTEGDKVAFSLVAFSFPTT